MPDRKNQQHKKAKQPEKQSQNAFNALTAICGILVSGNSIEDSLGRIASITSETMNSKACSVMMYDSNKQLFTLKAFQGISPAVQEKISSAGAGKALCGLAVKEKKIMTSAEIQGYGTPVLPGTREFADIKSMISAPIMVNGEPIGVINTYDSGERSYSEDEKKTMQAIADQSAAAIQLAKFREEAEQAKEALKDRKVIEKAKGILMHKNRMNEEQAYKAMRSKSMDTCKPIKEVAEAIILADEMRL